jgi:hypothetical protein
MSMSRKQKRETHALKAKNKRLRAKIAMRDGVLNTLPGTNAIHTTEEGIFPTASLVRGVDPDTDLSETGPPNDTSITERERDRTLQQRHCQKGSNQIQF